MYSIYLLSHKKKKNDIIFTARNTNKNIVKIKNIYYITNIYIFLSIYEQTNYI